MTQVGSGQLPEVAAELSSATRAALARAGLDPEDVARVVRTALTEDLRYGPDATTVATVPEGLSATAEITPRKPGVLAGGVLADVVFDLVAPGRIEIVEREPDGSRLEPGQPALLVRGEVRDLLTAERTVLNLLCHLSGVATVTAAWVRAVEGTGCAIRDTRKTLPGLRSLQKYAVRCGGGVNHRLGLGDAVLIKDNHVVAAGSVAAALAAVRAHAPHLPCEVEVTTLEELDAVLDAGAELVLLDNFTPAQCAEAVRRVRAAGTGTKLEASGGLTLEVARQYAETGVDYLAVGALTHSAPALDLGLDLREDR
ncbi:carboxylating nicotinate-nucleotide diphosphorylase [Thermasporomyces composti]|jgi:nicotinate-nucleotide pyrophosphorylase (carboxylating)|uniref:Nicotinate-nucleotide pyrophosphorylase [carboxylating] n=1 Tax=Thermasporomyces composti TaxID=696763 RepID=A0A3D9V0I2_THECX|nr:carboxylating nicotinate-nucleotide diphosphorylase [Thermasporomyces composti]REF35027.1 nicotinate-nucleotide pyrophosphorylase [carboxylating] [Thermasporomyces composti]